VVTSQRLQARLQARLPVPVELAMRYQHPSIPAAMRRLAARGAREVLLIPLFPHYAMSSFETAVVRVRAVAAQMTPAPRVVVQPPCFDDPDYLAALAASAQPHLSGGYDHLLFSFHGLPERHLYKADPTGGNCLRVSDCCTAPSPAHATCYRAQCFKTVAGVVRLAGIPPEKYSVTFQSRLGNDPWLKPYTDFELQALPKRGVKKLLVICPAFVADCLETLEEIGLRGRATFLQAGGREFAQIPCLNEQPRWIEALEKMCGRFLQASAPV
jgi:ferrochelatase